MFILNVSKRRHTFNLMPACAALCLLLTAAAPGGAQEQAPKRGFNPGESYAISDIETISTTGGNLSLSLPLGGLPSGRGGMKASVNLIYNSKLYDSYPMTIPAPAEDTTGDDAWSETRLKQSDDGGWRYAFGYDLKLEYRQLGSETGYCQHEGGPTVVFVYKLYLTLPDGSKHEMHLRGPHTGDDGYTDIMPDGNVAEPPTQGCSGVTPEFGTLTYYSNDGTYLRLEIQHDSDANWKNNPWTLYLPDGGRVTGGNAPQRIHDRNNNYIEVVNSFYNGHAATYITDQLGRSVIVEYNSAANQDSVHVRGANNELLTWTVVWTTIQVNKSYQAGSPHTRNLMVDLRVVSQINLPAQAGGLFYSFGYNAGASNPSHGWGEVSFVKLPSGAKAAYQYLRDGANNIKSQKVLSNHPTRKDLVYRSEYDVTSVSNTPCNSQSETTCITETWLYSLTFDAMGQVVQNGSVTGPDGGVSRDHVTVEGDVYKSERPDGTIVERQWHSNIPYGSLYGRQNPYVRREFVSIRNGAGLLSKTAIKEYSQDKNGNTTQVKVYDWVAHNSVPRDANGKPNAVPAGAPLKRVSTSSYYHPTPDASDTTTDDPDAYNNATAPRVRNAVAASEVSNGSQTLSRSEYFYDEAAAPTAGNLTAQKNWDSTKGAYSNPLTTANSVSTSTQYNSFGSPTLTTDPRGTQTQFIYGAVNGHPHLYPTSAKVAYGTTLEQTTSLEYDFYTGAVTRSIDPNGVATATSYDSFGRATLVRAAEGHAAKELRTATDYSDANRRVIVRSDLTTAGDGKLVSIQHFDQLGRVRLKRQLEDAATQSATSETSGVKVQSRYLHSGGHSYQLISNAYRAPYSHQAGNEPSMGWTRSKSDQAGRTIEARSFNGAALPSPWGANVSSSGAVTTAYDGEFTITTDQAARQRRSMVDAQGQLVRVDEPDKTTGDLGPTAAPVQPTVYIYDGLSNLTHVVQDTQTRTFNYSSLSRLTSASNPESGTIIYQHDPAGNLLSKSDARGITISYAYDALSRNVSVDYSNTTALNPDITRVYDNPAPGAYGRGRFWFDYKGGNYSVGSEVEHRAVDAYDSLGRPLTQRQLFKTGGVWSPAYTTTRTYTRSGNVASQTLPSGHTVSYSFDAAGRVNSFTGNLGDGITRAYASNTIYDEAGRLKREQFGTQTTLYHKRHYNTRGQLYDVRLSSDALDEWSWNRGAIVAYYDSASSWSNNGNAPTHTDNNGNVTRAQTWVPGNDAATTYALSDEHFQYDQLNRIKSMNEYQEGTGVARALAFTQAYNFDRWGNRTINQAGTTQTLAPELRRDFIVDTQTNRLGVPSGQMGAMVYDLAGNLTHDSYTGKGARTFDAENRMTSAVIGINSSSFYSYDADGKRVRRQTPAESVWQVYGMDGELLAEYAAQAAPSAPQKEYGYRNGELLVTAQSGSATTAAAVNVASAAQGATVTASSTYSANYPASAVINGDRKGTNWGAGGGGWNDATFNTSPDWLQIDFQGVKNISEINLFTCQDNYANPSEPTETQTFSLYGLTGFEIHYWTGSAWALIPNGSVSGNNKVWRKLTFPAISTSKIKVLANSSVDGFSRVTEIEAYQSTQLAPVNVAAAPGATATASSLYPYGTFTAGSAINGDRRGLNWGAGGGWNDATSGSFPDWLEVNFGSAKTIDEIHVFTCQDNYASPAEPTAAMTFSLYGLTGYEVQYWTGSAWATITNGSVSGNNQVWRKFTFAPLTTQKIRVLTNASISNDGYSRITEVEAYQSMQSAAATTGSVQWLVTDHLGTPRMIADLTGSLSGITRHDYLPFGEELKAGTGARTGSQGYSQPDGVRQQFTGHERDAETDLDFMQARYYHSSQGRFTSPDPLLASGNIYAPQSWNRYSYTINNPLKYTDPFGMYICSGTNEQCKQVENGLKRLEKARDSFEKGSEEYNRLDASRQAYGAKGVDNGLTIKFGATKSGGPAETAMAIRDKDGNGNKDVTDDNPTGQDTVITIDPTQTDTSNEYLQNLAHEGSHVADGSALFGALPVDLSDAAVPNLLSGPLNLTKYATETRAYETDTFIAQAIGAGSLTVGKSNHEIWNSSWREADRATRRAAGIERLLAEPKKPNGNGLYGLTPTNQGPRLIH